MPTLTRLVFQDSLLVGSLTRRTAVYGSVRTVVGLGYHELCGSGPGPPGRPNRGGGARANSLGGYSHVPEPNRDGEDDSGYDVHDNSTYRDRPALVNPLPYELTQGVWCVQHLLRKKGGCQAKAGLVSIVPKERKARGNF